jgi:hypothetical protein
VSFEAPAAMAGSSSAISKARLIRCISSPY